MRVYVWGVRAAITVLVSGTCSLQLGLASAGAADSRTATHGTRDAALNPYSPAYDHPYRHGVLPMRGRLARMNAWARQQAGIRPTGSDLSFGGGIDGIGVTTGPEKVYLVFYGSQWGTQGTDGNGNVTLSGDPNGEAPYLQQLMKGLGTGGELWSGVMTQYCEGVAAGSTSCPSSNQFHVGYPTGGALAGVWVDESTGSPASATGHQLAVEAINAAGHFGNTTAASNRDAQYVVLSPTGTNPDRWLTNGFCAWHDYNGDTTLSGGAASSPYGDIAFTNFPYVTDAGKSCGQNFVNSGSAGNLDGASIVEGHEYAETITDQNPAGGWTDITGSETGDKCAWIRPGATGGAANVTVSTGTFAMQSTWANDANGGSGGCQLSHPIVVNSAGGGIVNGGFETGTFSGWTTSGAATSIVSAGAHSGRYAARAGAITATNGDSNIAQTFTAAGTTLTFWYNVTCPDTVSYDWATATLKDNTTNRTSTIARKTCVASSGWKKISHLLISGRSYTLTLTSHDDNYAGDPSYTLFDDVSVH